MLSKGPLICIHFEITYFHYNCIDWAHIKVWNLWSLASFSPWLPYFCGICFHRAQVLKQSWTRLFRKWRPVNNVERLIANKSRIPSSLACLGFSDSYSSYFLLLFFSWETSSFSLSFVHDQTYKHYFMFMLKSFCSILICVTVTVCFEFVSAIQHL